MLVVSTLLKAIPELANLIIVGLLFFLIFGLMAVSTFKGSFNGCLVPDYNPLTPLVTPELAEFEVNMTAPNPLAVCAVDSVFVSSVVAPRDCANVSLELLR